MPEGKWKLHSSQNKFGKSSYQEIVKDGLGGDLSNSNDAVKHYQKTENK